MPSSYCLRPIASEWVRDTNEPERLAGCQWLPSHLRADTYVQLGVKHCTECTDKCLDALQSARVHARTTRMHTRTNPDCSEGNWIGFLRRGVKGSLQAVPPSRPQKDTSTKSPAIMHSGSQGLDALRGSISRSGAGAVGRTRGWGLPSDVLSFAPASSRRCHAPDMASLLVIAKAPYMDALVLCDSRRERRGADCDAHVPICCHHRRDATLGNEAR